MYEFALIIYAITLVASGFLCRDAYQHRFLPVARPLMIMSIILMFTCLIRFTQLVQPDLNQWILQAFEDIEFALIQPLITPLLVWLLLEYHLDKKIQLTHKILALFYIQPTITITLTLTDILTNGFLSQNSPTALINSQDRLGDYLLVRKIYTAVIITGIILTMPYLLKKRQQNQLTPIKIVLILLMNLLPFSLHILHRDGYIEYAFGAPAIMLNLIWGSRLYRVLDVLPLALQGIMNEVNTGVLVTSLHSKLLYINDRAQKLFGLNVSATELQQRELAIPNVFTRYFDFNKPEKQTALIQTQSANGSTTYIDAVLQPIFHPKLNKYLGTTISLYNISERKQAELELKQRTLELEALSEEASKARDEAVEANAAKSRFLAVMGHELRTPLNTIIGVSQTIEKNYDRLSDEKRRSSMGRVKSSGHHLLAMINEILDISRIEDGKIQLDHKILDLPALIGEVISESGPLLQKNNNTVQLIMAENLHNCWGDAQRLRQILLNLLSNAAKYTENDEILLTVVNYDEQSVQISVEDHGIGMDEAQISRLFQDFQQAEDFGTRKHGGTGLGLSLSRRLARAMQGDIKLKSEPGKGSRFTLQLPAYSTRDA